MHEHLYFNSRLVSLGKHYTDIASGISSLRRNFKDLNFGHGLKCFSEEGSEACNKLIRKYRENLARKCSFEDNVVDIFVRLASESDPVQNQFRSKLVCERCGEHGHTKRAKCCRNNSQLSSIDAIVETLILNT